MAISSTGIKKFYAQAFDVRSENADYLYNNGISHDSYANLRVIITTYRTDELIGSIEQGDRKVFILKDEYDALAIPENPKPGDRILFRGEYLSIVKVDDSSRSNTGDVIAYIFQARG